MSENLVKVFLVQWKKVKAVLNRIKFKLKRMKTALETWNLKTPHQKWCCFYKCFEFVGDNVLQIGIFGNLKIGIIGYVPCVSGILNYPLLIYTVYYYIDCGHFIGCLSSFCCLGLITLVIKMFCLTQSAKSFCSKITHTLVLCHICNSD